MIDLGESCRRATASGLARWAAMGVVVFGAAVSLWLNFPGHMSYDSVVQLAEGRDGAYGLSGHPPVMSWLLGVSDALVPGSAVFVVLDTGLIAGALVSFIMLGRRVSWLVVIPCAAVVTFPQLLIYPAIVWKDVLFAAAATAGFACLAQAAVHWRGPVLRYGLIGTGLTLVTLAAMARQNGVVILPFAAAAIAWISARSRSGPKAWRGLTHGLGFLGACAAIMLGGSAALTPPKVAPAAAVRGQFGNLQTYDMVHALVLNPGAELRVLHRRAPWFERLLRHDGVAAFSPIRIDSLQPLMEQAGVHPDSTDLIAAQWNDLFLRDPWLYLRVRLDAFSWVLLTPSVEDCVLIYTGVDGPSHEMSDVGLTPRQSVTDVALANYAVAFAPTPVYSHAAYGVLAVVLLFGLLRRRMASDIVVAAMLCAALAFAGAFLLISIACDYRYLYDLDVATIAASLYVAATWKDGAELYPRPWRRAAAKRSGLYSEPA